jgi:hypothetical protein
MKEQLTPAPETVTAELDLTFDPTQLARFEADYPGGPVIGFVPDENETIRLITIEHDFAMASYFLGEDNKFSPEKIHRFAEPVPLVYTPKEWVAYYLGAQTGQFEAVYEGHGHEPVLLRDSKNPEGPILVINRNEYRAVIDSLKAGKYNLPEKQHNELVATLEHELADYQAKQNT